MDEKTPSVQELVEQAKQLIRDAANKDFLACDETTSRKRLLAACRDMADRIGDEAGWTFYHAWEILLDKTRDIAELKKLMSEIPQELLEKMKDLQFFALEYTRRKHGTEYHFERTDEDSVVVNLKPEIPVNYIHVDFKLEE